MSRDLKHHSISLAVAFMAAALMVAELTARTYDPSIPLFQTQDPKATDYTRFNAYTYCGADPINNIDPTGTIVKALDEESILNICNTLTEDEAYYVHFIDGILDNDWLNKSNSESENMVALKALSNSEVSYIFSSCAGFKSKSEFVEFNTGDLVGITLMPNATEYPSPDDNVYILTYNGLTEEHQITNTAHEGYGHAYFYELRRQGYDVDPFHRRDRVGTEVVFDTEFGIEIPVSVFAPTNNKLENQIKVVEKQASLNYNSRRK